MICRRLIIGLAVLVLAISPLAAKQNIDVAAPTGNPLFDKPAVQQAIDDAQPGDIIRLAPGTYVIGGEFLVDTILVDKEGLTLRGHPDGTILRGTDVLDPEDLGLYEGMVITADNVTVKDLTFEAFSWAAINLFNPVDPANGPAGVEIKHNLFRENNVGVWGLSFQDELNVIRENRFIDNMLSFVFVGKTFRFSNNFSVIIDPANVPIFQRPYNVGWTGSDLESGLFCENPTLDNNLAVGNVDGFIVWGCRDATIKDNIVLDQHVMENPAAPGTTGDLGTLAWVIDSERTRIVGNLLDGSDGVGVELWNSTETIMSDNVFRNITATPLDTGLNYSGVGVYLDYGADYSDIRLNDYIDNATAAVVCYGNFNRMTLHMGDTLMDYGTGNELHRVP